MKVLNFNSQQCERVRRQLDAYLSNELLVETTSEVLRHLESCESCSHELDARTRLRKALRKAADQRVPPEHLREVISRRLRREQNGFFGEFRVIPWAVALASLVLVVVAAQQGLRLERGRQLVSSVLAIGVSDHIQCAIKGHNYPEVANPQDQLRKKLGAEYAGLLPIIQQKLPGFQVLEAHICQLPGNPRKYIHFITRGQGTILSVTLTKRDGESLPVQRLLVTKDFSGSDLYHAKLEGMSVAGFETDEYFGFVVSDLGQNEILRLAAAIAPPLRDALDRSIGTNTSATPVFLVDSVSSDLARKIE
ncbi:MAG: zf-HC2 domain-containing protein [Terriglobia bacterium]|jgi:anti-sigma factor (TIGR02949 family)